MTVYQNIIKGETPISGAPQLKLNEEFTCVPQHYLQFEHTIETVESIILDIEYSENYPVFVCEDVAGIYIQVGIIGYDNYISLQAQPSSKIVYGRKWRVEPLLPTSEIIQTVYLAILKAREHEVRELLRLSHGHATSTPFNTHHDLPVMAALRHQFYYKEENSHQESINDNIQTWLDIISYNGMALKLNLVTSINSGVHIVELELSGTAENSAFEPKHRSIALVLKELNQNALYHRLMSQLIEDSNHEVANRFKYRDFHRFSQSINVVEVGLLSVASRSLHKKVQYKNFRNHYKQQNYDTDTTRVPKLTNSLLGVKLITQLVSFNTLQGQLPVS